MSPRDLSPEQEAAVLAPCQDLCVVAGAGSGKTRVLTERYVEHVRAHGLALPRVAALTFTEKAARQMRARIAAALAVGGDVAQVGAQAAVLGAEFDRAPISTFHGFCSRLLRRNAVAAGVDPTFCVLDDTEAHLLWAQVRTEVGDRLAADPQARALLDALARFTGEAPLRAAAKVLARVRGAGVDAADARWHRGPLDEVQARAAAHERLTAFRAAAAGLVQTPDGLAGGLADALACADRALAGAQPLRAALDRLGDLPIGGKGSQPVKSARKALVAVLEALVGARLDAEAETHVWPAVREVLVRLDRAAADLKRARGVLDYDDLERETLRLLTRGADERRRPDGIPDALLIDEHQDTNPVQEAILARLRALGATQFSVGDPQQSIYRFRRADVRVLAQEALRVGPAALRRLSESYRATPEVVAGVNGLFARIFAGGAAGVGHAPLAARGSFAPVSAKEEPPVEWALLDRAGLSSDEGRRREAAYVAGWLRTLVAGGGRRRREKHEGPFGWGDCAILVRARKAMPYFEDALSEAGIPYRVHKGRGFLQADEVRVLVEALHVVHNPHETDALAALLRGPAYGARDDELLRWFGDGGGAGAWARLAADDDPRVRSLVATLLDLRRRSVGEDLPRLVARTVEAFGLMEAALLQPGGARRAGNLRSVAGLAEDVARAGHRDIPAFLRYLEELDHLEVSQAEAPALVSGGGEVALLTVHAAKGLEWPVVVVADLGRRFPTRGEDVYLDGPSVAFKLRDPLEGAEVKPGGYVDLHAAERRALTEERLRLLYVAATRAEERLLLTCAHDGFTQDGSPAQALGWARSVHEALGVPLEAGVHDVPVADGTVRLRVMAAPEPSESVSAGAAASPSGPPIAADSFALLPRGMEIEVAALGGTRYVVGVSELMSFSRSPAEHYRARLLPEPGATAPHAVAGGEAEPAPGNDPEGVVERRLARAPWDEPEEIPPPRVGQRLDRAALGRVVHALLERWRPGAAPDATPDVGAALAEEFGSGAYPGARAAAGEMLARFERSGLAARLAAALARGEDVRREVAFHARIRFPGGARVEPFDALLVKGTIDLWLPEDGEVHLVDFKTNGPTREHPTPASLAAHYAWQMRLYALAAERLLGRDVRGASLLLLDPGWGPQAVEVPVDVSGPALEEARRLCQALARAELENRWPADWRALLPV